MVLIVLLVPDYLNFPDSPGGTNYVDGGSVVRSIVSRYGTSDETSYGV